MCNLRILPASTSLLLLSLVLAVPLHAQKLEITPFVGFQFGGEFEDRFEFDGDDFEDLELDEGESYGLLVDVTLRNNFQLEFLYSRQESSIDADSFFGVVPLDVEVEYFHVGGLLQWTPGQFQPFVVATVGATRFSPEILDSEVRPSVSLGGGIKLFIGNNVGFRLEGRLYSTLIDDDDDEVFCNDRYCFTYEDSVFFFQWDVKAGVIFRF